MKWLLLTSRKRPGVGCNSVDQRHGFWRRPRLLEEASASTRDQNERRAQRDTWRDGARGRKVSPESPTLALSLMLSLNSTKKN